MWNHLTIPQFTSDHPKVTFETAQYHKLQVRVYNFDIEFLEMCEQGLLYWGQSQPQKYSPNSIFVCK